MGHQRNLFPHITPNRKHTKTQYQFQSLKKEFHKMQVF